MLIIRLFFLGAAVFLFAIFLVVLAGEVGAWASAICFIVVIYASFRVLRYSLTRY